MSTARELIPKRVVFRSPERGEVGKLLSSQRWWNGSQNRRHYLPRESGLAKVEILLFSHGAVTIQQMGQAVGQPVGQVGVGGT